jgi:hypothetical protein
MHADADLSEQSAHPLSVAAQGVNDIENRYLQRDGREPMDYSDKLRRWFPLFGSGSASSAATAVCGHSFFFSRQMSGIKRDERDFFVIGLWG